MHHCVLLKSLLSFICFWGVIIPSDLTAQKKLNTGFYLQQAQVLQDHSQHQKAYQLLDSIGGVLEKQQKWREFFALSNRKGEILEQLYRHPQAIQTYKYLLNKVTRYWSVPTTELSQVYLKLGNLYRFLGNLLVSNSYYQKSIMLLENKPLSKPDQHSLPQSYNSLGGNFQCQQAYDDAVLYFKKTIQITTNRIISGEAYKKLGQTYQARKQYNEAIQEYLKALKLLPANEKTEAYIFLGDAYQELKFYDLALDNYGKALKSIHQAEAVKYLATIYNQMAKTYLANHKISNSLKCSQKALIANAQKFQDTINVYNIPALNSYREPMAFLVSLLQKAQTFELLYQQQKNKFQLQQALTHYQSCDQLIRQIASLYLPYLQQTLINQLAAKVYASAENVCLLLNSLEVTPDQTLIQQAFFYSEKYKMTQQQLSEEGENKQKLSLAELSRVPDSILRLKALYESEIRYIQQQINESNVGLLSKQMQVLAQTSNQYKQAYRKLRSYLKQKYPYYYATKYGITLPAHMEEFLTKMPEYKGIVAYSFQQGHLNIYLLTHKKLTSKRVKLKQQEWEQHFQNFIRYIESASKAKQVKDSALYQESKQWLYARLIAPIRSHLTNIEQLVIVPDGHWENTWLFELLPNNQTTTGKHFLVQKHTIHHCPSVNLCYLYHQFYENKKDVSGILPYYTNLTKQVSIEAIQKNKIFSKILMIVRDDSSSLNYQFLLIFNPAQIPDLKIDVSPERKPSLKLSTNACLYIWNQKKIMFSQKKIRQMIQAWEKQGLKIVQINKEEQPARSLFSVFHQHLKQGQPVNQALQQTKLQWIKQQPDDLQWIKWLLITP